LGENEKEEKVMMRALCLPVMGFAVMGPSAAKTSLTEGLKCRTRSMLP
jgi:hypothetical protein